MTSKNTNIQEAVSEAINRRYNLPLTHRLSDMAQDAQFSTYGWSENENVELPIITAEQGHVVLTALGFMLGRNMKNIDLDQEPYRSILPPEANNYQIRTMLNYTQPGKTVEFVKACIDLALATILQLNTCDVRPWSEAMKEYSKTIRVWHVTQTLAALQDVLDINNSNTLGNIILPNGDHTPLIIGAKTVHVGTTPYSENGSPDEHEIKEAVRTYHEGIKHRFHIYGRTARHLFICFDKGRTTSWNIDNYEPTGELDTDKYTKLAQQFFEEGMVSRKSLDWDALKDIKPTKDTDPDEEEEDYEEDEDLTEEAEYEEEEEYDEDEELEDDPQGYIY